MKTKNGATNKLEVLLKVVPLILLAVGFYVFLNYGYGPSRSVGLNIWKYFRSGALVFYLLFIVYRYLPKKSTKYIFNKALIISVIVSIFSFALAGLILDLVNVFGYLIIKAPFVQIPK